MYKKAERLFFWPFLRSFYQIDNLYIYVIQNLIYVYNLKHNENCIMN